MKIKADRLMIGTWLLSVFPIYLLSRQLFPGLDSTFVVWFPLWLLVLWVLNTLRKAGPRD